MLKYGQGSTPAAPSKFKKVNTMIVDQLKEDQLQARKDRDAVLASFLTTVFAEVVTVGKDDGNRETTDQESIAVLKKYIKRANEMKTILANEGSMMGVDGIDTADFEIEVINRYLPKQLSADDLNVVIAQIIEAREFSSMQDMGKTMQALKAMYEGTYDGATAVDIVRQQLGKL